MRSGTLTVVCAVRTGDSTWAGHSYNACFSSRQVNNTAPPQHRRLTRLLARLHNVHHSRQRCIPDALSLQRYRALQRGGCRLTLSTMLNEGPQAVCAACATDVTTQTRRKHCTNAFCTRPSLTDRSELFEPASVPWCELAHDAAPFLPTNRSLPYTKYDLRYTQPHTDAAIPPALLDSPAQRCTSPTTPNHARSIVTGPDIPQERPRPGRHLGRLDCTLYHQLSSALAQHRLQPGPRSLLVRGHVPGGHHGAGEQAQGRHVGRAGDCGH
eukprot:TRINITY_DN5489_c0_g1_i2.p1 TRINITY_DN5489_c0_g1~~TRINITY_DN5489_c0_g1_i2.p1  ORF type:complete len:269 (+),score=-11.22 TRINITY_DN5489_c0_g1_i2:134-940(+)